MEEMYGSSFMKLDGSRWNDMQVTGSFRSLFIKAVGSLQKYIEACGKYTEVGGITWKIVEFLRHSRAEDGSPLKTIEIYENS